ncbi:protein TolA, partial [Planoprotostelium fungivorum]
MTEQTSTEPSKLDAVKKELLNWSTECLIAEAKSESKLKKDQEMQAIEAILKDKGESLELSQYDKWTVNGLRDAVRKTGQSTSGSKDALIERLRKSPEQVAAEKEEKEKAAAARKAEKEKERAEKSPKKQKRDEEESTEEPPAK